MLVVSGQSAEFEALFRAHYEAVCRYAARRVEQAAVADLAAEVFLVAWRRRDEIEGDPLPWLLGVARRVCANHLRSRGRQHALGERLAQERPAEASAPIDDDGLRAALESLHPGDRELLTLIAWERLENREVARMLGCSPATLAVRLHRARRRLAVALAAQRTASTVVSTTTEGAIGNETC